MQRSNILDQSFHFLTQQEKIEFCFQLEITEETIRNNYLRNLIEQDIKAFEALLNQLRTTHSSIVENAEFIQAVYLSEQLEKIEDEKRKSTAKVTFDFANWTGQTESKSEKRSDQEIFDALQRLFEDSLSLDEIADAVITPQGTTYDKASIKDHINRFGKDPIMADELLPEKNLRPNHLFKILKNHYTTVDAFLKPFPSQLYSEKTNKLFIKPIVNSEGKTIELLDLLGDERKKYILNIQNKEFIQYQNLLAVNVISLVKEARANHPDYSFNDDELQKPSLKQKEAPHSNGLFKPNKSLKRIELDDEEHGYILQISNLIIELAQNPEKCKNLQEYDHLMKGLNGLNDIIAKKLSLENFLKDKISYNALQSGAYKEAVASIIQFVETRDQKKNRRYY